MEKTMQIVKENIPEAEVVELTGMNGNKVLVEKHIPYEHKEAMAFELFAYTSVTDEENGVMYDSFKKVLLECVLVAKYYTNIDISGMDAEENMMMLMDWLVMNELYEKLMDAVHEDYQMVQKMYEMMKHSSQMDFEAGHNLSLKIQKMLGMTVDNEDLAETLAKSEEVNNTMVNLIGAYKKQQEADRNKDKMPLGNGAVISLAKKAKKN